MLQWYFEPLETLIMLMFFLYFYSQLKMTSERSKSRDLLLLVFITQSINL